MKIKSFFSGFLIVPLLLLVLTFVVSASAAVNANPTITLEGPAVVEIMKGGTFVDDGASCADTEEGIVILTIDKDGFNKNVAGVYTFTYTCTDGDGGTASTTRTVTVTNQLPSVTLEGPAEVEIMKGGTFVDDGVSCTDVEDGIVILTIDEDGFNKNSVGEYTFTYTCTDEDGGTVSTTRKVTVKNGLPSATLEGSAEVEIAKGSDFIDDGVSCTDVEDGIVILTINEGGFDKNTPGTYTFTYTCTDEDKGTASATRKVTVKGDPVSGGGGGAPGAVWIPALNVSNNPVAVAPVQVGQVLGAETTSCTNAIYLTKFLRKGYKNDVEAVKKLQKFLNEYENANLKEDGVFGPTTEQAVKNFQKKYEAEILTPWNIKIPTGIFYLTTQKKVNSIICPELSSALPVLLAFSDNPETPNR